MLITKELIEQYWLLTEVVVGEVLQEGHNRTTGIILSTQGKFVYKSSKRNEDLTDLERRLFVHNFLQQRGYTFAPKLLLAKDGKYMQQIDNEFVHIMEYVEGKTLESSPENYCKLGELVGTLNSIKDYPYPCLITVAPIMPAFPELAQKLPPADRGEYLKLTETLPRLDYLPQSLIHFEVNLRHVIERPSGELVFIDWDEAGTGATVLDPGYPLISYFVGEDLVFEKEHAQAFYAGYFSKKSLTNEEKGALFDASLFHALRYVIYDVEKRWKRIQWAVANKELLNAAIEASL